MKYNFIGRQCEDFFMKKYEISNVVYIFAKSRSITNSTPFFSNEIDKFCYCVFLKITSVGFRVYR